MMLMLLNSGIIRVHIEGHLLHLCWDVILSNVYIFIDGFVTFHYFSTLLISEPSAPLISSLITVFIIISLS